MRHDSIIARAARLLLLPALAAALATGCDDDGGGDGRAALGSAWTAFESGDGAAAEQAFVDALARDATRAEAWLGLGWSRALRQTDPAEEADLREGVLDAFRHADRLQADHVDAWAGLAHFHAAEADTVAALEWSLDALELAGNGYVFAHRPAVDGRSLRRIAALNLLKLGRWDESLAQVQAVFAGWTPDAAAGDTLAQLLVKIGEL